MPIYEYECSECGRRVERLQRVDDPPPASCECGGSLRRLISAPAFQFKGSGWYATDYAGRKSSADGDKDEGAKKAEAAKSSEKDRSSEKDTSKPAGTAGDAS